MFSLPRIVIVGMFLLPGPANMFFSRQPVIFVDVSLAKIRDNKTKHRLRNAVSSECTGTPGREGGIYCLFEIGSGTW